MKRNVFLIFIFVLGFILCSAISSNADNDYSNIKAINVDGDVLLENNKLIIKYDNNSIELPQFDIYLENNDNKFEDQYYTYYIADALKSYDKEKNVNIICFGLYYNDQKLQYDNLNVQIYHNDISLYYNVHISINEEERNYITSNFRQISDASEEVKERINASIRFIKNLNLEDKPNNSSCSS